MTLPKRVAIIGASLAGAHAALTLRRAEFAGDILLVGDEDHLPYERPSLSKEALSSDLLSEPQWVLPSSTYSEQSIQISTGRRVDSLNRRPDGTFDLELTDRTLQADLVLLTTGGRPRRLTGFDHIPCLHYLRNWDDAVRLRSRLNVATRLVVIGSGFIGAEVGATAAARGCHVDIVDQSLPPFPAIACEDIRKVLRDAHEAVGTKFRLGVSILGIEEVQDGKAMVRLSDGTDLIADAVVAGVGMVANGELASTCGAKTHRGAVVVDPSYRTSVAGLFAAGDVAATYSDDGNLTHTQHWLAAQQQGAAAALSMLGQPAPKLPVPWFWSDQLGQRLEIAGDLSTATDIIVRRTGDRELSSFHLDRKGKLVGAIGLNSSRLIRAALSAIGKGAVPDRRQLAEPGIPFAKVLLFSPANIT